MVLRPILLYESSVDHRWISDRSSRNRRYIIDSHRYTIDIESIYHRLIDVWHVYSTYIYIYIYIFICSKSMRYTSNLCKPGFPVPGGAPSDPWLVSPGIPGRGPMGLGGPGPTYTFLYHTLYKYTYKN